MAGAILTILPPRESCQPDQAGAIALCVRDFTRHSRYCDRIITVNAIEGDGFPGITHRTVTPVRRWHESATRAYARAVLALAEETHAELLEVHNRPLLARLLAEASHIPVTLHLHNDPLSMRGTRTVWSRMHIIRNCAAILTVSEYISHRLLESIAPSDPHVHVVYNGLEIPPAAQKQHIILFVGRLTSNKGGLIFVRALQRILPQLPGWQAVLVGARRHSPSIQLSAYEQEVERIVSKLAPQVINAGFCNHAAVMQHFAQAAIAVVPSLWPEPFGRTALEAMASGCAVISSGRGGLQEVTGSAALTLPSLSEETLASALLTLAQQDAQRHDLQQAARQRAPQFDISGCTKRLDDIRARVIEAS